MLEKHIKDILKQAGVTATIGDLPGDLADAVAIIAYNNGANTEYFGSADSTLFNPVVKIVVRNSSYETAFQLVSTIQHTLHRYTDKTILSCFMVGTPSYLGKSAQKLHEFQVVFNISIKE